MAVHAPPPQDAIDAFLAEEVALLDAQDWDAWNALFNEDGLYWVPAAPDQPDPYAHVSLMFDDALLRKVRIARFSAPDAYSLQPFPRSVHVVSRAALDRFDPETGRCETRASFVMLVHQRDRTSHHGGIFRHSLDWDGERFRIAMKRVDLVDADGAQECLNLYF